MLNAPYLQNYQSKLYPYFRKSFYINKESIRCFLDKEYSYGVRDRQGRVYFIFLSEIIKHNEEVKLNEIKQKFHEPFPHPSTA